MPDSIRSQDPAQLPLFHPIVVVAVKKQVHLGWLKHPRGKKRHDAMCTIDKLFVTTNAVAIATQYPHIMAPK